MAMRFINPPQQEHETMRIQNSEQMDQILVGIHILAENRKIYQRNYSLYSSTAILSKI
jgi:hypothetical protein